MDEKTQHSAPQSRAKQGKYLSQERTPRRKRRRRKSRAVPLAVICVLLVAVVVGLILGITHLVGSRKQIDLNLVGTWEYDPNTQYEFDNKGNGSMILYETRFPYTYTVKEDQLYLDFESEALLDATYRYLVEENTLTIIGGEGTVGGTYQLTKVA